VGYVVVPVKLRQERKNCFARKFSVAPPGLAAFEHFTHGCHRGLLSVAAPRLRMGAKLKNFLIAGAMGFDYSDKPTINKTNKLWH
jgi:hypothetical protein